jgi:hypothetical protein
VPRIKWNEPGQNFYEAGVDRGVLYPAIGDGVPWNGLTAVNERPSGGAPQAYYIDGIKYENVAGAEEYEATIQAYTYPDEFAECDGSARLHSGFYATQQPRKRFGFTYRTKVGNELTGEYGYKIHLVYGALAAPSDRDYGTLGDSVEALEFSWDITTLPPATTLVKPTAHFEIDTRSTNPSAVTDVENILYGSEIESPRLPTLDEIITIFDTYAILSVTDNLDGTFTISGPDEAITFPTADTVQITWPSVVAIDASTYSISSL